MRSRLLLILTLVFLFAFSDSHIMADDGSRQVTARILEKAVSSDGRFVFSGSEEMPFKGMSPFTTFAIKIPGARHLSLQVEYRTFSLNKPGSHWQKLGFEGHGPSSPDLVTDLLFVEPEVISIEYRISGLSGPDYLPVELHYYLPEGPFTMEESSFPASAGRSSCELPEYVTRVGWGCPTGEDYSSGTPSFTNVTHLAVHHSAGSNSSSNWAAVVLSIWNYHVFTNGWSDIAYNVLVAPNGVIYEGRGGNQGYTLDVLSAATCGSNSGSMAVCVLGNYNLVQPPVAAMESLERILAWKAEARNIDPLGSSSLNAFGILDHIFGHRQGCTTECPGENLFAALPSIRQDVYDLVQDQCSPGLPELTYLSHTVDDNNSGDSQGNNNGIPESGETIEMYLSLQNTGASSATNVTAVITTDAPCITFIDNDITFGTILPGSDSSNGDFDVVIGTACPTGEINLFLEMSSDEGTWHDTVVLNVVNNCLPVVDFTADPLSGPAPLTVRFYNISSTSPNIEWVFPGGQPSTSTDQSPVVTYQYAGSYPVLLRVYNECGVDSLYIEDYIVADLVSGIDISAFDKVTVWPNPSKGMFNYSLPDEVNGEIAVTGLDGRVILTQPHSGYTGLIDLSDLNNGIYMLSVKDTERKFQGSAVILLVD